MVEGPQLSFLGSPVIFGDFHADPPTLDLENGNLFLERIGLTENAFFIVIRREGEKVLPTFDTPFSCPSHSV